ncbi:MAG: NUDIX hydrolase [Eubacteriales bacterium]|nr:NUDIX hydrolase [Eubacteriales bacterium]
MTREEIAAYSPWNDQEAREQQMMLRWMELCGDLLWRTNALAHFTASAWVVNPARDRVLMAYHHIYQAWAWLGGHADGEADLLGVAMREAREESGIRTVEPLSRDIFSVEILNVEGHRKRGEYVGTHAHLNLTYLLEADDTQALHSKPDENAGVRWVPLEEAVGQGDSRQMKEIYAKLNDKLRRMA